MPNMTTFDTDNHWLIDRGNGQPSVNVVVLSFVNPVDLNLRARTYSETRGFVKALVEADSDRILGFTVFGVGAGEILATVQIAMTAGLPYTALRDAVLTHPTLVEGLIPLFSSAASAHNVVKTRGAQISGA